jgi:hypothetical protein
MKILTSRDSTIRPMLRAILITMQPNLPEPLPMYNNRPVKLSLKGCKRIEYGRRTN